MIATRLLRPEDMDAYGRFIESCGDALIYHSPRFLDFLARLMPGCALQLLVAADDSQIVGALPMFAVDGPAGRILNSLPYFGSHGDILVADSAADRPAVAAALLRALADMTTREGVAAINIVAHPLSSWLDGRAGAAGLEAWDERISQITELGEATDRAGALDQVLATCQQKTRNLVRKGLKSGFSIAVETDDAAWRAMAEHHRLGMIRIGGKSKSDHEFDCLRAALQPGDCRLHVARKDGAFAGALLTLHDRAWVEYFTPVAVEEHRNSQVLSALIAHAMCDAILERRKFWNWGGTWSSQAGVYHFKSGWGAKDRIYKYWGRVLPGADALTRQSPSELAQAYPFFYVRPFRQPTVDP